LVCLASSFFGKMALSLFQMTVLAPQVLAPADLSRSRMTLPLLLAWTASGGSLDVGVEDVIVGLC
jgi:hypothetical protein